MVTSLEPQNRFRQLATTILGGLTGCFAGLPVASTVDPSLMAFVVAIFAALGLFVGHRKRNSTPFFYLSLVTLVVLISIFFRSAVG